MFFLACSSGWFGSGNQNQILVLVLVLQIGHLLVNSKRERLETIAGAAKVVTRVPVLLLQ